MILFFIPVIKGSDNAVVLLCIYDAQLLKWFEITQITCYIVNYYFYSSIVFNNLVLWYFLSSVLLI